MRFEILNLVCQGGRSTSRSNDPRPRLALYAQVCFEWQCYFEKITFGHLLVDNTSLEDFARLMGGKNTRRKAYVRHIMLLVVLPGYSCPSCQKPENWFEIYRNNRIFIDAMELLGTLSTWAPEECSGGLTLELGIKSSSDPRHYYNDATVYNSYPFRSWDNLDEKVNMRTFHIWHLFRGVGYNHAGHLRFLGYVASTPGFQKARRYLGSLLQFQGLKKRRLPRVEIINSLLIRHQFKRQMSPLALAKLVHESLVNIASFRLERWCRTTNKEEEEYLKDFRERLLSSLPRNITSFHSFAERFRAFNWSTPSETKTLSVMGLLCSLGHRLTEISLVTPSGTGDWFAEMQSIAALALTQPQLLPQWHKLERICFRSGILRDDNDLGLISRLLLRTAPIAESHTRPTGCQSAKVSSCLFRYSVEHSDAILSWESYWQLLADPETTAFELYPQVKCAWEKAAVAHTGHGITTIINEPKGELLDEAIFRQYFQPGYRRLAEVFKLDPIHPFTRVLMGFDWDRNRTV